MSLTTVTIAGLIVLAALIWILMRMRSTDLLEEKMAKRRGSSRLVSRADLVEGMQRIPVALASRASHPVRHAHPHTPCSRGLVTAGPTQSSVLSPQS